MILIRELRSAVLMLFPPGRITKNSLDEENFGVCVVEREWPVFPFNGYT